MKWAPPPSNPPPEPDAEPETSRVRGLASDLSASPRPARQPHQRIRERPLERKAETPAAKPPPSGPEPEPTTPPVVALEAWFAEGVSLAVARLVVVGPAAGKVALRVESWPTVAAAAARARALSPAVLLAGKSLANDPAVAELGAEPVGGVSRAAVMDIRRLIDESAFIHDDPPNGELTRQVLAARFQPGPDGPRLISRGRMDAIKAAVWAIERARMGGEAPRIF